MSREEIEAAIPHRKPMLLLDEIDAWPLNAKNEGDPVKLVCKRAAAYEAVRKICYLSSPTVQGQSQIEALYLAGDQRKYFVRCVKCNAPQTLKWERVSEHGVKSGIVWELENERLVPGSVRYACCECGHEHSNSDKERLLSPAEGLEPFLTERARNLSDEGARANLAFGLAQRGVEEGVQLYFEMTDAVFERKDPVALVYMSGFALMGEKALPSIRELGIPEDRVNVNGGSIAIGHPLGATGARLVTTVAHELRRSGGRYGLATQCIGAGMGISTILERID